MHPDPSPLLRCATRSAARLGCLFVPLFPLAARLRSEPDLAGQALAIVEGNGSAARVAMASRSARRAGIVAGATLAQARAILPKLIARPRDAATERAAQDALAECAESVSPRVERAEPGVALFDASGLERRFENERELAQALLRQAERMALPTRVGIAGSRLAARIAAEQPATPTIVPPGQEAAFLAPLALARLAEPLGIRETLERWGVRSIGDFARLPEADVLARLGRAGHELLGLARGFDPLPFVPQAPPVTFEEGLELEWPLVALEPFLFVAKAAIERLVTRLDAQGLACRRLELELTLEPDGHDVRAVDLPAPTREVAALLTLLRLSLDARAPGAPVTRFLLRAEPDQPRRAQLSLFGPPALSPDRLATTLTRLAALVGPDRVGAPVAVDSHVPEAAGREAFDPPPPPRFRRPPHAGRGLLAVRVLRPPVPLTVDDASGRPSAIEAVQPPTHPTPSHPRLRGRPSPRAPQRDAPTPHPPPVAPPLCGAPTRDGVAAPAATLPTAKPPPIAGRVRVAAGPWRLDEGWWSDGATDRDYWDVELEGGGLFRVYRDRAAGCWFADGVYD